MWLWHLFRGIGLGVAIAAPVGPIGLLCIRRSLTQGQMIGLATGLGAATADGVYGCIAGFGLTAVSQVLVDHTDGLKLFGGLFLCYLGLKAMVSKPPKTAIELTSRGLIGAYASTFVLTLTNPATILSFIAIFAGLGLADGSRTWHLSLALVAGVFVGSAFWWLCLSWGVARFQKKLTSTQLVWLNRLSGMVIFAFGLVALRLRS